MNSEVRKNLPYMLFLLQQYYHNFKQQYQRKFFEYEYEGGHFQIYLLLTLWPWKWTFK